MRMLAAIIFGLTVAIAVGVWTAKTVSASLEQSTADFEAAIHQAHG